MQEEMATKDGSAKILYVTRDIERAMGASPSADYMILTNRSPYSLTIKEQFPDYVHLVDPISDPRTASLESLHVHEILDTNQLLETEYAMKIVAATGAAILVFKNNSRTEAIAKKNGWRLLNPSAAFSEKVENKMTQVEWLDELGTKYLPEHSVVPAKSITWNKEPLVIQWEHGHTGDGTTLVNNMEELHSIQIKFPNRIARVTKYVSGPSFTMNVVAHVGGIYRGNINYQITGLPPFTDNAFSTVGNDWSLPHSILTDKEIEYIENMAEEIGAKMLRDGWKGLFGIDIIKDSERDIIYLIEINARQPASTTYESFLQQENRRSGVTGMTTFEAHIASLRGDAIQGPIIPVNDGSQVIQRVTHGTRYIADDAIGTLELGGYRITPYQNTEHNMDLLRIQCARGIMESHGKLNSRGKEIAEALAPIKDPGQYPPPL